MPKKIIALCASLSFYKNVIDIEKSLRKKGFKTHIPVTAKKMKKTKDFDETHYRLWLKDPSYYKRKTYLINNHNQKIVKSDAILVINLDKKGIKGYIGGNVLMEMALAFHLKKPIFVLNSISENHPFKEEIFALDSIFLDGNLNNLPQKI